MSKRTTVRLLGGDKSVLTMRWSFLVFALWSIGVQSSQESPQAPRIEAKQKTEKTPPTQENTKPQSSIAAPAPTITSIQPVSETGAHKSTEQAKDVGEQETEFWPPLFGYRLKVTDTLLVAFTALLFAATVFLYFATRDLVHGADETAKKELRAYLGVRGGHIKKIGYTKEPLEIMGTRYNVFVHISNSGKTPAKRVTKAMGMALLDLPPHIDFVPTLEPGNWVIAPNGAYWTFEKEIVLSDKDIAALNETENKKKAIFIWGRSTYKDIFGKDQWVEFRYRSGIQRFCEGSTGFSGRDIHDGWKLDPEDEGNDAS